MTTNRYHVNDSLTAALASHGWSSVSEEDDEWLNELTHQVADRIDGVNYVSHAADPVALNRGAVLEEFYERMRNDQGVSKHQLDVATALEPAVVAQAIHRALSDKFWEAYNVVLSDTVHELLELIDTAEHDDQEG